ncbi:hypothetical protein NK553_28390 [Pseudomonas sp. ZM23]|uniref:Uncharacterized protein n=1 Tax=Pseudomonas triclosanedens TaxID=2961893 RepID=A0ABY6ZV07_9PSED|nr:hypothetical protein [Pseudomonas triclosanedens]MCP8467875.1 hypothetical protein [Pseudomonas triclosanedens]MCP8473847.1 hypothetical protein [Pseudomonas triclosanedens]MCP8479827.1 hypothetical protein [Pseudomonas triclosanedens]WAI48767.1 hypothetical protein OU419_23895 [Pseudomonas triclosanedens]
MRQSFGPLMRAAALFCGLLLASSAQARMESLNDEELSSITGQAMLTVDALTYGAYQYTRLNFGADIDILTNIDELRLGDYTRSGSASSQPADIQINNFALGRVTNSNSANAAVEPFQMRDPFIEFAFKTNASGVRELAGVRVGFGKALGYLSGDIQSLSGNLQGKIYGPASIAYDYYTRNGCPNIVNCLLLAVAGDTEIEAEVGLVKANTGEATTIRAEQIGIPKGTSMNTTDPNNILAGLIPVLTTASGCKTLGLDACFNLTNYKSIFIGQPGATDINAGAQGIFFSLQNQNVPWQDLANAGNFVNTQSGAYANFPKVGTGADAAYPILINLYDALRGLARQPTCMGAQASGC